MVTQAQPEGWPLFRLPLEIRVAPVDGEPTSHPVDVLGRVQRFRFPAEREPTAVTLDPEGWVLQGNGQTRHVQRLDEG